jgi:hypothetical protein
MGALLTALMALLNPASARPATTPLLDRVYERRLMSVADGRCRLFPPDLAKALDAAALQARGAALRAGAGLSDVTAVEGRAARRADGLSCRDPDLLRAATKVRDAFKGYADMRKESFPGTDGVWEADRRPQKDPGRPNALGWRLVQIGRGGDAAIAVGLAAGEDFLVVAHAPSGWTAGSARLIMRDPQRAAAPFFDPRTQGLAGKIPPVWLTTAFLARDIRPAPEGAAPPLQPALLIAFPASAATAIRGLDPRESVRVELVQVTRTGERVRSAYFEVGDFAAASAFLEAGRRR